MSTMSCLRRKLMFGRERYANAVAEQKALFKLDEYLKHRTNALKVLISIRRERHAEEDRQLAAGGRP